MLKIIDLRHQKNGQIRIEDAGDYRHVANVMAGNPRAIEDARLFVAAPDLLEACKDALHVLTPVRPVMDGLDRTRMYLREAIKKATGEAP